MRTGTRAGRIFAVSVVIVAWALTGACSKGGGETTSVLSATFTPDVATPGAGSISLLPGTATDDVFQVRVVVTGVSNFFGTAFHLSYNKDAGGADNLTASFMGWDTSGSFLNDGHAVNFSVDSSIPGLLTITATREFDAARGATQGVDVTTSRDLAVLTFRAILATSGNRFLFTDPREVRDGTQPPPGNLITVTWNNGTMTAH